MFPTSLIVFPLCWLVFRLCYLLFCMWLVRFKGDPACLRDAAAAVEVLRWLDFPRRLNRPDEPEPPLSDPPH